MSHGDRLTALPPGFVALGKSENAHFAAIAHLERRLFGIQFHPEVAHTPRGRELIEGFLFDVVGLAADWTPARFVEDSIGSKTPSRSSWKASPRFRSTSERA
jgi:GMP synthase (glutamine-hydrolysing)